MTKTVPQRVFNTLFSRKGAKNAKMLWIIYSLKCTRSDLIRQLMQVLAWLVNLPMLEV